MKMTVKEVVSSHVSLQQFGTTKFPMQVSLHLAHNLRVLGEVAEMFNKQRKDLIRKYGKLNDEIGAVQVIPKHQEKFNNSIAAIVKEELDLDLKTVSVSDLGKKVEMEPNTLVHLGWMITSEGKKAASR